MRLDKWLLTEAFSSRAKAQDAIQEGRVPCQWEGRAEKQL